MAKDTDKEEPKKAKKAKKDKNAVEEKPEISPLQAQFNLMSGTEKAACLLYTSDAADD